MVTAEGPSSSATLLVLFELFVLGIQIDRTSNFPGPTGDGAEGNLQEA